MRRWTIALALAASFLFVGRQADAADNQWGAVKGRIVWSAAELPKQETVPVAANQKECLANGPISREDWVVNAKNKGIRWAFVWLAPDSGQPLPIHPDLEKASDKPVVLDQPCCQFEPHAVGLRQGQVLQAKNSAGFVHNVNWTGIKNPGNNLVLPPGKSLDISGLVADKYPLKVSCNIHPWMTAWVRIFDHPYFAVTDADGNFELKKAPAGKYRLVVWHESAGFRGGRAGRNGTEITIRPDGVTDLGDLGLSANP